MKLRLEAACGSDMGRIRTNNEDNFFFDGKCLELEHNGIIQPLSVSKDSQKDTLLAVFDGIGGENYGEDASYYAARAAQDVRKTMGDLFRSTEKYLAHQMERLNAAVLEAKRVRRTDRMGTTVVSLYFDEKFAYVCNVGDSRAYRVRNGEILQISWDHVARYPGRNSKKCPITQHLGMDPADVKMEPYIAKYPLEKGDRFVICSDGLTDMVEDAGILQIMNANAEPQACVQALIRAALEAGGRDNVTVAVCQVL